MPFVKRPTLENLAKMVSRASKMLEDINIEDKSSSRQKNEVTGLLRYVENELDTLSKEK